MLVFFMLSFILRQLDYIWHGFHFTNMIPYRFSFLFSFVVLVMAYRGYQLKKRPRWQVALSMVVFLGLAACSDQRLDPVFLIYNLGFCALYGGLLLAQKRPRKVIIEEEDGPTVQIIPLTGKETHRNRLTAQALLGSHGPGAGRLRGGLWRPLRRHRHLQLPQRQGRTRSGCWST